MEQTAVEWLEKRFQSLGFDFEHILKEAKVMEKQQIKDAWDNGIQWEWDSSIRNSEEYYNKTFKSE